MMSTNEIFKKTDLKYCEAEGVKFNEQGVEVTLYYLGYDTDTAEKVFFVDGVNGEKYGTYAKMSEALIAARIAIKNNR